jgi:hypothetical protein
MLRRCAALLTVFLFIAGSVQAQTPAPAPGGGNAEAKEAARDAASEWLDLTDAGEFGASYDAASSFMQDQVDRKKWVQMGEKVSDQVGELQSRDFMQAQYRESIPQAEGGPFVVLMYSSQFSSGPFREAVVAVKEEDAWKVAGYQVVPPQPAGGPGAQGGGR